MRAVWLFVCLFMLMQTASGASAISLRIDGIKHPALDGALVHKVDVIGRDQRVRLPKDYTALGKGIGIVFQPGGGWACTAFCVKPTIIATNAHCLFGQPGQRKAVRLDRIRFALAAVNRGGHFQTSNLVIKDKRQPGLSIYSGYYRSRRSALEFKNDWALAKLRRPICKGAELKLQPMSPAQVAAQASKNRLSLIGYHGDKHMDGKWLSRRCRIRSTTDRKYLLPSQRRRLRTVGSLVLHTCDATRGASGAPLFVKSADGPKVVAINAGTIGFTKYRRTRSGRRGRIVVSRATNVAVLSRAFADGLDRFANEPLLRSVQDFERVQRLLRRAGLYEGPIDGVYGPASRSAIVEYERRNQLASLGLPTAKLLQHLGATVGSGSSVSDSVRTAAAATLPSDPTNGDASGKRETSDDRAPLVQRIQRRLYQLGCYQGPIDGLWGPQSRRALRTALRTTQPVRPSSAVLARLRGQQNPACK